MERNEIIDLILPAIIKANPKETPQGLRGYCEQRTDEELKQMYDQQIAGGLIRELTPEEDERLRETAEREASWEVKQLKVNAKSSNSFAAVIASRT